MFLQQWVLAPRMLVAANNIPNSGEIIFDVFLIQMRCCQEVNLVWCWCCDAVMLFWYQDMMFFQQWVFWSVDAGWVLLPPIAQPLQKWFFMLSWFRWDVIRISILYDADPDAVMLFQQQDLMFFQQWVFSSIDAGWRLLPPITQILQK